MDSERTRRLEELGFVWDPVVASWENHFDLLKCYGEEHGDCFVPQKYEAGGIKLGNWVYNQRQAYSKGTMESERKQRLEELGFVWDPREARWEENFGRLKRYSEDHGECFVPQAYAAEDGTKLGEWVNNQRRAHSKLTLDLERTRRLEELGFAWDPLEASWENHFDLFKSYSEENGCAVPQKYETEDGTKLGEWVNNQRRAFSMGTLNSERTRRLEEAGFIWNTIEATLERYFDLLNRYREEHRGSLPPLSYETEDGTKLGEWANHQREAYYKATLGKSWDALAISWEGHFDLLKIYQKEHGGCIVPSNYEAVDGTKLGKWVNNQRQAHTQGTLNSICTRRLEELGFVWDPFEASWNRNYDRLKRYREEHVDSFVPQKHEAEDGATLVNWINNQRRAYSMGTLNSERTRRLEELGFVWDPWEAQWNGNFDLLKRYGEEHGDCFVPQKYESDGIKLGIWVYNQRQAHSKGTMNSARTRRLEELGFVWEPRQRNFDLLERYREEHDGCLPPLRYREEDGTELGVWVYRQRRAYIKATSGSEKNRRLD
jgi:Fe2+ transport system protein FeoA